MSIRVFLHYGGTFVEDPVKGYVGGSVKIIENVGLDYISLFGLSEYHFSLHPAPHVNLYYLAPGYEIWEGGALLLRNDSDVIEMIDCLVNDESEEVHIYGVEMEGPIQVVGTDRHSEEVHIYENDVETDRHSDPESEKGDQSATDRQKVIGKQTEKDKGKQTASKKDKGKQKATKKGKQKETAKGKQTEKGKTNTKQSMEKNKNQGRKDIGEEEEHPSWMDEDLEGPGDDDIFEEGKKKNR